MEEALKQININKIIRFGFPSFYLLIRIAVSMKFTDISLNILLICCAGGLFIYPLYKSTYWVCIRYFMSRKGLIPQLKWHKSIVNSLPLTRKEKMKYSTMAMCSTCISICLNGLDKKDTKVYKQIELQNTAAHLLYMTSFLSIILIITNILFDVMQLNYLIEIIVAVCLLISGVLYDKSIADMRELVLLKQNSTRYVGILKELISAYKL